MGSAGASAAYSSSPVVLKTKSRGAWSLVSSLPAERSAEGVIIIITKTLLLLLLLLLACDVNFNELPVASGFSHKSLLHSSGGSSAAALHTHTRVTLIAFIAVRCPPPPCPITKAHRNRRFKLPVRCNAVRTLRFLLQYVVNAPAAVRTGAGEERVCRRP